MMGRYRRLVSPPKISALDISPADAGGMVAAGSTSSSSEASSRAGASGVPCSAVSLSDDAPMLELFIEGQSSGGIPVTQGS